MLSIGAAEDDGIEVDWSPGVLLGGVTDDAEVVDDDDDTEEEEEEEDGSDRFEEESSPPPEADVGAGAGAAVEADGGKRAGGWGDMRAWG